MINFILSRTIVFFSLEFFVQSWVFILNIFYFLILLAVEIYTSLLMVHLIASHSVMLLRRWSLHRVIFSFLCKNSRACSKIARLLLYISLILRKIRADFPSLIGSIFTLKSERMWGWSEEYIYIYIYYGLSCVSIVQLVHLYFMRKKYFVSA